MAVAATPRCPPTPVIHHVASPTQRSTFSFSLAQRRSLASHFRATGPQLTAPAPEPTQCPSGFTQVVAPCSEGQPRQPSACPAGTIPAGRDPRATPGSPPGSAHGPLPSRGSAPDPRGPHPPIAHWDAGGQSLACSVPSAQASLRPAGLGAQGGWHPGGGAHHPHLLLAGTLAFQARLWDPRSWAPGGAPHSWPCH